MSIRKVLELLVDRELSRLKSKEKKEEFLAEIEALGADDSADSCILDEMRVKEIIFQLIPSAVPREKPTRILR